MKYLVELFRWHMDKDRSGFICGYRDTADQALFAQQVVEYQQGNPCRVVIRKPSQRNTNA